MKKDKRPVYIWISVIFANLGTLFFMLFNSYYFLTSDTLITLFVTMFLTAVPILISGSNYERKNYLGYGIPILLLLPVVYSIYYYYTCTGKFCDLGAVLLGFGFGLSAITFALFYAIGIYFRKWNIKFVLTLIGIEIILIVGSIIRHFLNQ